MCKCEEAELKFPHQTAHERNPKQLSDVWFRNFSWTYIFSWIIFIVFQLNNILLDSHKTNNNDVCGRAGEKREYLEMGCQICTKLLIFASVYEV